MIVHIHNSETTPTLDRDEFIQRRLEQALEMHAASIERVDIWIIGIVRGERGPANYCKVDVTLGNGNRVVSEATETDMYLAIDRAADRAGWAVSRCLGRQRRRAAAGALDSRASANSGTAARLADAM